MSSSPENHKTCRKKPRAKKGFTILEVTIVLALTGLLLVGILGGTSTSIRMQRYNDSVRSFAEHLRTIYSEVINPESLGFGNASDYAVLGKVVVFGYQYENSEDDTRSIYDATLVGKVNLQQTTSGTFFEELNNSDINIYCGQPIGNFGNETTVSRYEPLWQAQIDYANQEIFGKLVGPNHSDFDGNLFRGTLIIARSPKSGAVHTAFTTETYNLRDQCRHSAAGGEAESGASDQLKNDIGKFAKNGDASGVNFGYVTLGFCVKSENAPGGMREIRLAADGRNTSAVSLIDVNPSAESGEINRCQD